MDQTTENNIELHSAFFDSLESNFDKFTRFTRQRCDLIAQLSGASAQAAVLVVADHPKAMIYALLDRGAKNLTAFSVPANEMADLTALYPDCFFIAESAALLEYDVKNAYDLIIISGLLPGGFDSPEVKAKLCALLRPGGRLCVAAPSGRYAANAMLTGQEEAPVFPAAALLSKALSKQYTVDISIDAPWMYMVSGVKK